VKFSLLVCLLLVCVGCAKKQPGFVVAHRYTLTGTVVSLNSKNQTASVDSAAIPNYMEAMTMDYPIPSKTEFDRLRVGEKITATLNVNTANDEYNLTGIQEQSPAK
jgi:Cu/Ag efflux protein CusF